MAIKFLGGIDGKFSGTDERSKNEQGFWTTRRKFTRVYHVLGDSLSNTETQILACVGVPALGDKIGTAFCINRSATETNTVIGAGALWEVTCEFDSDVAEDSFPSSGSSSGDPEDPEDPTLLPPKRTWSGETGSRTIDNDTQGDPIETKAGEKIAMEGPDLTVVYELERYSNYPFNPNVIMLYQNTTNQDPFYGAPSGSSLIASISADEVDVNGVKYILEKWQVRTKIRRKNSTLQQNTWNAKPLNQGTQYRPAANQPPKKKTDEEGNLMTCNLNEDGTERLNPPPIFLDFQIYEKKSWADLGLEY